MKWYRSHKSTLIVCGIFLLLPLLLKANDEEEKIKRGAARLNALIARNAYNDAHGLSYLNDYIFDLDADDKYVQTHGKLFINASLVQSLRTELADLANKSDIHFYIALNGTQLSVEDINVTIPHEVIRDKFKPGIDILLNGIYRESSIKNLGAGKNALFGITPIQRVRINPDKTKDKLYFTYLRDVVEGSAFPQLVEIVNDVYQANHEAVTNFKNNPDEALKGIKSTYVKILSNYSTEVLKLNQFKTQDAANFFKAAMIAHGNSKAELVLKIAQQIDKIGPNWYGEFGNERRPEPISKNNSKYIDILSSKADEQALQRFLNAITKYATVKAEKMAAITTLAKSDELGSLCSVFTTADFRELNLEQRKHILKVLASDNMAGNYLFNNNEEGIAVRVLKYLKPEDFTALVSFLETEKITASDNKSKHLFAVLVNRIDDGWLWGFGGNNYNSLVKITVAMVKGSTDFNTRVEESFTTENFTDRMIHWGNKNRDYGKGFVTVKSGVFSDHISIKDDGKVEIKMQEYRAPTPGGGKSQSLWKDIDPVSVDPFDLVFLVHTLSLEDDVISTPGELQMVPAIVLKYANDKLFSKNVAETAEFVLDAATIASTGGALAAAKGLSRARKVWLAYNLVSATASVIINVTDLDKDPDYKMAVGIFQIIQGVSGLSELSYGAYKNGGKFFKDVYKAGKDIAGVSKNALKQSLTAITRLDINVKAGYKFVDARARQVYEELLTFKANCKQRWREWFNEDFPAELDEIIDLDKLLSNLTARLKDKNLINALKADLQAAPDLKALLARNENAVEAWEMLRNAPDAVRRNHGVVEHLYTIKGKNLPDGTALDVQRFLNNGFLTTLSGLGDADRVRIMESIADWNAEWIDDLARRLGNTKYAGLADDLKNPVLFNIYDRLIRDPLNARDIVREMGLIEGSLNTAAKSVFFNDVTALGKNFEGVVSPALRSGSWRIKLKSVVAKFGVTDLDNYQMVEQVQLVYNKAGDYFIADQVFVKFKKVDGFDVVDDIIVIENKLSEMTKLTGNQELARAVSSYTVRGGKLGGASTASFKDSVIKWVKVYDSEKGDKILDITDKF